MKGIYNGAHMRRRMILPGAKLVSQVVEITKEAERRLKWFDWYQAHGRNARKACRHFGISPDTFYRWKARYKPGKLVSLESHSRKPKHFRQSKISLDTIKLIKVLRKANMGLSKYKLQHILKREHGVILSTSSIGRVLKGTGLIKQSQLTRDIHNRKRKSYSIPRVRAAKQLRYKYPGRLVQIDTKHLIILGQKYYQFTAVDCYSRVSYSYIYTKGSSACARDFLIRLLRYFPFKVEALQTDNGSEYLLHFHQECETRGIVHYFSHPHTPKDNTFVERMIQTTIYELWLFDETLIPELKYLNTKLATWVGRYNNYRPHQSLGYLTPMEFYFNLKGGDVSGMY